MDTRTKEGLESVKEPMKMENREIIAKTKFKSTGSFSSDDMIFRADKIDLKNLDMQLEKHLSRVFTKNVDSHRPKEEWEIDLSKMDIKYVVARGTFGTVYRGTYDNQDVAGRYSPVDHFLNYVKYIFLLMILFINLENI